MPIKISFNGDNCPEMPTMVLATKSGSKHGVINNITDVVLTDSMSSPAELSFQVHKSLDGNPCVLWNELVDFKLIWCKEWDRWFSCEVSLSESGEAVKNITAYSLGEYELSQILLFDVEINTEDDIARPDYTAPTIFYDPLHPDSSLLHRILSKAPHYTIGHVDSTIERLQRTFSFSNRSIKDCFDDVAEEIGCLFVYDTSGSGGTLSRSISVYDLEQTCLSCGYRGEFTGMCPECGSDNIQYGYGDDTAIFVSTDNLTQEISYTTDAGSVKNCFHLSAGDDLMTATIRACNPAGGSYLWYIPEEVRNDMTPELRAALASYDESNDQYTNTREYELDASLLAEYNSLINKYSEYDSNLSPITSPVIGYAALMQHYFDVLDFGIFLQTSLMPEVIIPEKTAESQAALITQSSMSPVAVSSLTESTSRATAESAIKTVVRALIDTARFSFTVNSESWNNPYWTGTVTVTSRTENEHGVYNSATSERMTLSFTDDYATYLRQVIDKKMRAADTDDLSISSILRGPIESLVARLGQYSYDCLSSMADCCQDVLNVLIDAGASNQLASIPNDLYTPYYNKLVAIQSEMDERADEILIVTGNSDYSIVGLQQVIEQLRNQVQDALDLQNYLGETMWLELCSYRREEEYSNDNYVSDGLSNADLITNALEFLKKARKEIFKSATLQHSISSTLSNLLAIDAFKPILSFFEVGNWIRVRVDDVVYRLRLLSYTVDFSSFSQIQVEFSDVTKNMDGTSDVSSLLGKASAMSSSFSYVQKQATNGADSKHILENWVANGLATTQAKIMDSADNQDIVWDRHGMIFRRYDPITEEYNPKQLKIVNSTMAITDDDWRSTKTAVGRFFYQDPVSKQYVEAYGINAETVVGKMILGQSLGIYNESGSLKFDRQGLKIIGTNNTVTVNPNGTHLFNISKGTSDILYVDSNGDLHIKGNITADSTISANAITAGILSDAANSNYWNLETGEFRLASTTTVGGQSIATADTVITDVDVEYRLSDSATELSGDYSWSTVAPAWVNGKYMWQRTATITGGVISYSSPTCISGAKGASGTSITIASVEYAVGTSGTAAPSSGWQMSVPSVAQGKWLWCRTIYSNGTFATTCSYMGTDGEDGNSVAIQSVTKTGKVTTIVLSSSDGTSKTLTISDGEDGTNGIPGANGYVHIAWATSADGSEGFSTTVSSGKTYIGVYTDSTQADSNNPSDYSWSLIKGDTGTGVSAIVEQYYLSTSDTTQSGGSWSSSQPAWTKNKYIWTRSVITWTDGTTTYTSPVLAQAINGANKAVDDLNTGLDQQGIFNRLTNNGQTQGIFLSGGKLYINADYIQSGKIGARYIDVDDLFAQNITATKSFQVDTQAFQLKTNVSGFWIGFDTTIQGTNYYSRISCDLVNGIRINSKQGIQINDYSGLGITIGASASISGNLSVSGTIYEGGTALSSKYAAYSHTHSGYASSSHTHSEYSKTLTVESKSTTISVTNGGGKYPGGAENSSFSVSKSGYTPLGIVGWSVPSSGSSYLFLPRLYLSGTTCYWAARNIGSSTYSGTLTVDVLYVKN